MRGPEPASLLRERPAGPLCSEDLPDYLALDTPASVTPGEVVDAFTKANPALSRQAISVACDGKRLTEVWLCLAKDFSFRACPEISRRACRRDRIAMPALRGGR